MSNIVSMEWLKERLDDPQIVVVDCRFTLGSPQKGRQSYEEGHIPGAIYFDLEEDMSDPVGEHGGRHPLPDLGVFSLSLGKAGIGSLSKVVAYDDQGGAMAARFWWMLRFLGHEGSYVLDGGFAQWQASKYPISKSIDPKAPQHFVPQVQTTRLISMDGVKERLSRAGTVLVDSREQPRYLGEVEPIDAKAGHIPGAVNHFWKESLTELGLWKDPEEQRRRFADLSDADEIIVYCGSGVTACPNVLALDEAGFKNVKLYSGSWSDWISYEENSIATGEE